MKHLAFLALLFGVSACAYITPTLECSAKAAASDLADAEIVCTVALEGHARRYRVLTSTVGVPQPGPSSQPSSSEN